MNKVEIYYFSGTGNSLHIAKELEKRMSETKLIPILDLLNKDNIEINAEIVGFVFPIYLSTTPHPVREFFKKIKFKSTEYVFCVTTNCGYPGKANIYINKLLEKRGKSLDSYFTIRMMGNSPKGVQPSFMIDQDWASNITNDNIEILEVEAQNELDNIQKVILNKEKNIEISNKYPLQQRFADWASEHTNPKINYYTDSSCTGCSICKKVCLSKKIKIENGKPKWQENIKCYYCYACFNYCPEQSILVKNYTKKDGRYYHPNITVTDIAQQKGI